MEDLRTKAQKVMDVLEKPEVIAALRQDKAQNLQYLKENYKVRKQVFVVLLTMLIRILSSLPMIPSTFCTSLASSNTTVVITEVPLTISTISAFW